MIVFDDINEINGNGPAVIALGNFDGVHLGHVELIRQAVEEADRLGVKSAVFTFSNHPRNMFSKRKVKSILYMDEKRQIIESMGIDYMFDVPFTEELMKTSPEDFVTEILVRKLKMMEAVCGFNYTFGYKAAGTYDYLKEMGDKLGFAVREVKPFKVNGRVVSSTLLRNLISRGRVDRCRSYMGRNYAATGTVVKGDQLGRTMGFPTCNLDIDASMVTPPAGSYITLCKVNDKYYHAVTNVGKKPTVGKYHKNIETHILDFSGDLYGQKIVVEFLKRIRGEKKFSGLEELEEQIKADCQTARDYFAKENM